MLDRYLLFKICIALGLFLLLTFVLPWELVLGLGFNADGS